MQILLQCVENENVLKQQCLEKKNNYNNSFQPILTLVIVIGNNPSGKAGITNLNCVHGNRAVEISQNLKKFPVLNCVSGNRAINFGGNFPETFGNFLETVVVVIGQESVCVGMWSHLSLYYIWFRQNTVCYCVFDYYLKERFKSLDIRNILENYDGGCIRQF